MNDPLVQLTAIAVFSMGAQWLGWRLRLPSILLLLLTGFVLGPVLGIIDPDALLGETLFPFVSLAVGIILFEGGLTLNLKELPSSGRVIFRLISVGALATWIIATLGARFIVGFDWSIAVLAGAILIVTGPTVVGPLLRQIRPRGEAGTILKWEGILIDPVGAVLAVLVFEVIRLEGITSVPGFVLVGVLRSLFVGIFFGLMGAGILITLLRRYLIPDHLQNGITLLTVVALFTLSNLLAPEGGLLTVTVMGIALANQRWISIRHILEFKENLQVLLIGVLFILLAGRIDIAGLMEIGWGSLALVAVLIVVARPVSVWLSTWRTNITRNERLFLMCMAPRGIVAASVASIFAFELTEMGNANAASLASVIFIVIVGTVVFYGLAAGPVARRLDLAELDPQGVLMIGAQPFARRLAKALGDMGIRVLLVDSNYSNIVASSLEGLEAYHGNALSEETLEELDLGGIGRMAALTSNDDVNSLAVVHFLDIFSRSQVYQLPMSTEAMKSIPSHLHGRFLFDAASTYNFLQASIRDRAEIKTIPLTPDFTYNDFLAQYGERATLLGLVTNGPKLALHTVADGVNPRPGQTIISLVLAESP